MLCHERSTKIFPILLPGQPILQQVHQNPYLGVLLSNDHKWAPHIAKITGKASATLGLLKRNLKQTPEHCRKTAYVSLIRPTLEYASSVWDPYYNKDITKLEQLQRKAVRFIVGDYTSQHDGFITGKMEELNLQSLKERRRTIRLVLLFKVVSGLVPAIDITQYLTPQRSRRRVKPAIYKDYVVLNLIDKQVVNNSKCFKVPTGNTEQFNNSFFVRTVADWNQLDNNIVTSKTVTQFKQALQPD